VVRFADLLFTNISPYLFLLGSKQWSVSLFEKTKCIYHADLFIWKTAQFYISVSVNEAFADICYRFSIVGGA